MSMKVGDEVFVFVCGFRGDPQVISDINDKRVMFEQGGYYLWGDIKKKFSTVSIMKCSDYLMTKASDLQNFRDIPKMTPNKGADRRLSKAKEIVAHFHKQCILEGCVGEKHKGKFQDIKFTTYAIAKKLIEEFEE